MSPLPRLASLVDTVLDRTIAPGYSKVGYAVRSRLPGWPADPEPGRAGRSPRPGHRRLVGPRDPDRPTSSPAWEPTSTWWCATPPRARR